MNRDINNSYSHLFNIDHHHHPHVHPIGIESIFSSEHHLHAPHHPLYFIGDDSNRNKKNNNNNNNGGGQSSGPSNANTRENPQQQQKEEEEEEEELVTPFGGPGGSLTLEVIISQSSSQIIAFFTQQLNTAILADFSGGEVLAVLFMIMFLLLAAVGPVRKLISTEAGKGYGWRLTLGSFIDFIARISLLLAFDFASRYLAITWMRLGFNLSEKIITTVTLAFSFFGAYSFYLSQYSVH